MSVLKTAAVFEDRGGGLGPWAHPTIDMDLTDDQENTAPELFATCSKVGNASTEEGTSELADELAKSTHALLYGTVESQDASSHNRRPG